MRRWYLFKLWLWRKRFERYAIDTLRRGSVREIQALGEAIGQIGIKCHEPTSVALGERVVDHAEPVVLKRTWSWRTWRRG